MQLQRRGPQDPRASPRSRAGGARARGARPPAVPRIPRPLPLLDCERDCD